jgi:eukaryotic-like serine/threonine-protein kinase
MQIVSFQMEAMKLEIDAKKHHNRRTPVTARRYYPWWTFVFAAICVMGDVFLVYYTLFGVGSDGVSLDDKAGRVVITDVDPQTPAATAGLQVDDEIVSVNGQRINTEIDWLAQRMNFMVNQPTTIRVEHGGTTIDRILVPRGTQWEEATQTERVAGIIFLASKLITLAIGLFVVFSARDFVSRFGGWVLVVMATPFNAFPWGLSTTVRAMPFLVAVPTMLMYVSAAFRTPMLAAFFCLFPRRLFASRWLWGVFWAGPLAATASALYLFARTIYDPSHLSGLAPKWLVSGFGVQSVAYLVVVIVVLPVSYWQLETQTDRRRFRVLVFGTLTSMLFYLPRVIGTALLNVSPGLYALVSQPVVNVISAAGTLILPFSFAYAILKQRLFDVRVIIRRGVQYALARRVLLAIPVVVIGMLIADVLAHGKDPLFSVLKTHVGTYVAIAALTALASTQRQKWLSALDRRFFRDKYDAQQLFRDIVEEIRRAETVEQVASHVVARVSKALHTSGCGLMLRKPGEPLYRVVAAAPQGSLNTDLPTTNKLIPLVRTLECSVPITQAGTGWLGQQLPAVDKEFLQKAHIELLVPVALKEGSEEALLVLSGKLSEEPYSKEDIALLENVASALALLLMRGNAISPGRAFEECPHCGACYDTGTTRCSKEGTVLTLVASPRLLAGRYRLDGRLGQGGMGKVYRATDNSLNRQVAVKMIRDEFFADGKAIEKFRQESQLTGSFTHPNVVTVFDFGVEGQNRIFLVMELLEGITLRQELRAKRRLDPHRTLQLFEGICSGVAAAHAHGLIHRDLKPENIFLSRKVGVEVVKITDFGIAKALPLSPDETRDTITGALVGTVRYMSPEQLRGGSLSPRWDLWALAVIAYEVLCGAVPFSGDDVSLLQTAIMGVNFPSVQAFVPDAPSRWQEFFEGAFAHEQGNRAGTVAEFWQGLQECLG